MFEITRTEGAGARILRDDELVGRADQANAVAGRAQRELFGLIREIDRREAWRRDGARDIAHWVWMRYGISAWKAQRWVSAAEALESLPRISAAFEQGELGIDKVVELTRFATPETEVSLIDWARDRASGTIRRRADLERRRERSETVAAERGRSLRSWYSDDGARFGLEAELPADQGALVASALSRLADSIPAMPDADRFADVESRRADALVMLCSGQVATDPAAHRATLVVHTKLETLSTDLGSAPNAEIEGGPVLAPETAQRLACDARIQVVLEDHHGQPLSLGRLTRTPSAAMVRQLRWRDRSCRFPGCGKRRFTDAHHVRWWSLGGRTDLNNLALLCSFHHRLVHEHGWSLTLEPNGHVGWFRPNGVRYRAGPAPLHRRT